MSAEQRPNNGQSACFDDKTLAETWMTCTVFIDALYRDIDYIDAEQMPMLAYGSYTTLQASAVLLGCPQHRVFLLDYELTFEPRLPRDAEIEKAHSQGQLPEKIALGFSSRRSHYFGLCPADQAAMTPGI
eukprot:6213284-Pleurochrysis_carterae.AAC.1